MTVDARKLELQLRLVRAILRAERRHGLSDGLAARASAIVEPLAPAVEVTGDVALMELLADVRDEIAAVVRAVSDA